jgi:hypothetical protein
MDGRLYYKDENVKVTDLRITCNHVTIPIDRVEYCKINLRVDNFTLALVCFILSLISIYVAAAFFSFAWSCPFILLAALSLIWLKIEYSRYVELIVSTGVRKIKLLNGGMNDRERLYKIADALSESLIQKEVAKTEDEDSGLGFSVSDTMKLKKIIMNYDKE